MKKKLRIYFSHSWNDEEGILCLDGNNVPRNHAKYVKHASVLIFKLNEDGVISKGILNEIRAAQEAGIPIYLWKDGKLTDNPEVLAALPLRKWKRNFSHVSHPFEGENGALWK